MSEALLLTGGRGHPATATDAALQRIFASLGIGLDPTQDIEAGLARLDPERHVLLVVNALQFTMAHERYDDLRADHAFSLSRSGHEAISRWHDAGRPILALHTAVICFDDWRRWGEILGGRWDWNRSFHPPIGPVAVQTSDGHFTVEDERYTDLDLAPGLDIVATSDGHPVAWINQAETATVGVDLLGHDFRSLDAPGHERLLTTLIRRLLEPRP